MSRHNAAGLIESILDRFAHAEKAVSAYKMWHDKPAKKVDNVNFDLPETVRVVGTASAILYSSDKWERDREFHDYVHDFDSGPKLYAEDGDGASRRLAPLLGTPDVHTPLSLPVLAYVKAIEYVVNGEPYTVKFPRRTRLVCTASLKTLIVLHRPCPYFVTGGDMDVTARGIVK